MKNFRLTLLALALISVAYVNSKKEIHDLIDPRDPEEKNLRKYVMYKEQAYDKSMQVSVDGQCMRARHMLSENIHNLKSDWDKKPAAVKQQHFNLVNAICSKTSDKLAIYRPGNCMDRLSQKSDHVFHAYHELKRGLNTHGIFDTFSAWKEYIREYKAHCKGEAAHWREPKCKAYFRKAEFDPEEFVEVNKQDSIKLNGAKGLMTLAYYFRNGIVAFALNWEKIMTPQFWYNAPKECGFGLDKKRDNDILHRRP